LSLLNVIWKSAYPHVAVLGKIPGKNYYRNIERFENAKQEPGLLVVRMDDQLFFGNASFFREEITELVDSSEEPLSALFIDAKSIKSIDSSAVHTLQELYGWLNRHGIELYVCAAIGPVRDMLKRSGLYDLIGKEHHFIFLDDAVEHHKDKVLFAN
jgi:SulP family sulfate permease